MNSGFPIELADLCVKCGLCAPHCPTYTLSGSEPESPRGRIAMMTGIATGAVAHSDAARLSLDHCLSCQACEAVCPAQVPYLQLLDSHRAEHAPSLRGIERIVAGATDLNTLRPLLRLAIKSLNRTRGLALRLAGWLSDPKLLRWLSLIPDKTLLAMPTREPQAQLQLLVGCSGDLANRDAIVAFLRCCEALNLTVDVLPAAHCCGALAQHRGQASGAANKRQRLSAARIPNLPLVSLDSACASQLHDEDVTQVEEACAFLQRQDWSKLVFQPLDHAVLIHQPCSHRNGLRQTDAARNLLSRIPNLLLQDIQDPLCCGAAGLHMLEFPQRADALLQPKLDQCAAQTSSAHAASHLVTTNIGCAMHFAAGLRRHDIDRRDLQNTQPMPKVCHPIELLAQSITKLG